MNNTCRINGILLIPSDVVEKKNKNKIMRIHIYSIYLRRTITTATQKRFIRN